MELKININMDGAAVAEAGGVEIAEILSRFARAVEVQYNLIPGDSYRLRDTNGNTVGKAEIIP